MPLNFLGTVVTQGTGTIPYYEELRRVAPYVVAGAGIKYWSRGSSNKWERNLHGKVFIVTGATSQGMGTSVVLQMAARGAQLIILCRNVDEWDTEWCEDLRERTKNELIYMEQCDLSDLWQVRKFVTGWLDNSPPRRLDGVVVMSGDTEPIGGIGALMPWNRNSNMGVSRRSSKDGLELQMATNFVGVFHLLNLLQPSFKAQPPDRDVRIIVTTCWLQSLGQVDEEDPLWQDAKFDNSLKFFASSKLQLGLCMMELQHRIVQGKKQAKKDKKTLKTDVTEEENDIGNLKVIVVNPGLMRSQSLRRVISNGSIIWLVLLYCTLLYPILWLFVKSGSRGAENILYSLTSPEFESINLKNDKNGSNCQYVTNCSIIPFVRREFQDTKLQARLFDKTEKDILVLEKQMAIKRNQNKKKQKKGRN